MTRKRRFMPLAVGVSLVAASLVAGLSPASAAPSAERVKGDYIVQLRAGVDARKAATAVARRYGGVASYTYDAVLNGFAFEGPDAAAARLASDRRVASVDADYVVHTVDTPPDAADHLETTRSNCTQSDVTTAPPDECQPAATTFPTAEQSGYTGLGTLIGILDTGVRGSHPFFSAHHNVIGSYGGCVGGARDLNGHGTATASNAAGRVGVAHEASIFSVKVFPGSGESTTWSKVICGLNFVRNYNADHPTGKIGVVNLSIAGPGTAALKTAVEKVISSGVVVAAAAGNDGGGPVQAPAQYAGVISASALNHNGTGFASFSAHGADIAAPGVSIFSARLSGGGDASRSGTSRSSPQIAGAAAVVLALGTLPADVQHVLVTTGRCPGGGHRGTTPCSNWPGGSNEPRLDTFCAAILAAGLTDPHCV